MHTVGKPLKLSKKNVSDVAVCYSRSAHDVLLNVNRSLPVIGSMHESDQIGHTQGEPGATVHLAKILMKC